jgi:diguanylate cyclase (GGDEF)-like protein/PAS domain S-box-containing protein
MTKPRVRAELLFGERFFALSQDLMCVADRDRMIVAVNPAFETLLGWPAEDAEAMSLSDLTHPDDLTANNPPRAEAADGKGVVSYVNRSRKSDGTYVWIRWTASINPATGLTYAVGKDMTELEPSRLAAIVDHSDDAIVGEDLDLRVSSWNASAERMYGYSAEEIIGQPIGILIPPERDGEDRAISSRVLAGETVDHLETVRLHKDGRKLDVSISVSPIRDPAGRMTGASSIARDITGTESVSSAQTQAVKRLLLSAEFRDNATGQQVVGMSGLCGQIAGALGWDSQRVGELESAATMHDVGAIAIPDSILLKPGALTPEERAVMETHATVGERMLRGTGIAVIDQAAEIALTHHERFDGTGYPRGLSGEAIPISGRIAAAADVFDALTSERVYRPAFSHRQAVAMMSAESGTQFDPATLEALIEVLKIETLADTDPQDVELSQIEPPPTARQTELAAGQAAAERDQAGAARDQSQADADQRFFNRDQAGADRARAAADRDRAAADRDQSELEADRRSLSRTKAAARRDLAAAARDQVAAQRDQAQADRHRAGTDPAQSDADTSDQAGADRDHRAAGRSHSQADRAFAAADRKQSGLEAKQRSSDRDEAAADRNHSASDNAQTAAERRMSQAEARQRHSDRYQAAVDRQRAATDRQQAATDRATGAHNRKQAKADLRRSQVDQLTGALGRELGMVALEREINRARHGNGHLVLAYVDIDGLKAVNDSQGHAAGDELLRNVVSAIQRHLRSYDPVVRVGGDEFVCALSNSRPDDARRRFREIAATIEQTQPGASVSVGFAELRPEDTLDRLTERGDKALYEAKSAG